MTREWTENEKRAGVIIIVFGIVIGYFALALTGVLPDSINLVESVWGDNTISDDDNTTQWSELDSCLVQVTGIPDIVNTSASGTNSYTVQFMAMEGSCGDMSFRLMPSMTNATIEITEGLYGWVIADDGLSARYCGGSLIPYEATSITLTIGGDQFTKPGSVMVLCSSDGRTAANEGLVTITT